MPNREIVIESRRPAGRYWRDLWRCRELFYLMTWRDILLRYKHMTIGFAWAILRPVLTMLVFSLIFGRLAKLPSGGVPYPVLVYTAMLPWQFFATTFADAGNSLINKESIITKIYFPRLMVPLGSVIVSFVDFLAASTVMVGLMAWYHLVPDWRVLALPLLILLLFCFALGAGLWISMLSARFKDFRYLIPFLVQMGLYISPVGFNSGFLPGEWRAVYALNPMVGVIDGFRWALLGISPPDGLELSLTLAAAVSAVLVITGTFYFRRMERALVEFL